MNINWLKAATILTKDVKSSKCMDLTSSKALKMPSDILAIFEARNGLYKIAPEEKLIDTLSKITTSNGKAKFSEKALRAEIKRVNMENYAHLPGKSYSDSRCDDIAKFAELENMCVRDVAEYALLPCNAIGFVRELPSERLEIFKEFMQYTKSDRYISLINECSPRRFNFDELCDIAKNMPEEQIKFLKELMKLKRGNTPFMPEGNFLFSGEELLDIVSSKEINTQAFLNLSRNSGLNGHSILELTKVKDIDLNKATKMLKQIKKSHNGDVIFSVERDVYEPNKFRLMEWSKSNDKEVLVKTFDEKMNHISTDTISRVAGKNNQARIKGADFEVIVETHTKPNRENEKLLDKMYSTVSETRYIRDNQGNLLGKEILEPSKVKGLHNWRRVLPDGTVKPIIEVKTGRDGALTVNKNLESIDGTLTKSKYKKLQGGSWVMRLNISKDGQILSKRNVKHKRVSANKSVSTVNGKTFDITYSPSEIRVVNSKGEVDCIIDLKTLVDSNNTPQNARKLKRILQECSADELKVISEKLKVLEFNETALNAYASFDIGKISCSDDIFIFRHELGHINDLFGTVNPTEMSCNGIYSASDKFKQIYSQELDMFMKEFPQTQRSYVDYFINHSNMDLSKQSFKETVAELTASNSSPSISTVFGTRTEYLERYFPQTRGFLVNA